MKIHELAHLVRDPRAGADNLPDFLVNEDYVDDVEDLPEEVGKALPSGTDAEGARTLADVERDYILAVVRAAGGNRTQAASELGIGVATLYRKLKSYGAAAEAVAG